MKFETKLARLEEIVGKMEKGDLTLEESLKTFEEGVKLSRECQKQLQEAELQVKKLVSLDERGSPVLEDMTSDEK